MVKNKDGSEIPADEFIVFRPADNAVPPMLRIYHQLLNEQGASEEQLEAVFELRSRVAEWRDTYPDRCKVADVQPGELKTKG